MARLFDESLVIVELLDMPIFDELLFMAPLLS